MDFWQVHGIFFIIFMFFFPRLTMFFATPWGGLFWWLGWLFLPRLTVAILATNNYWETNKFLVVLTWIWALGGESAEKTGARRTAFRRSRRGR
jgi:hypothetical protein